MAEQRPQTTGEKLERQNLLKDFFANAAGASKAISEGMILLDSHTLTRIFVSLLQITDGELEEILIRRATAKAVSLSNNLDTEQPKMTQPAKVVPTAKP